MMISHTIKFFLSFFIFISITSLSFALSSSSSEYSLSSHDNLDKFSSSDEQVLELFQLWKKEHGKQYENSEENAKRFETFRSNLKHINEINAKRKSPTRHRLSLNKFADISPEEFSKTYLQETPSKYGDRKLKDEDDDDCDNLPASVDWRKEGAVTEVKDQGNCQSHWAFAVVGTIEGFNKIVTGNLIELSAQELVDCDPASHGCAGGFYFNAFGWVINNGGIDTEANYPYTAKNGTCKENANKAVSIDNLYVLDGSEEALLCQTSKQPVIVSLDATGLQFYAGGIYGGENCKKDSAKANLVGIIVGYDSVNGEDYWIVKNSWGKDWGEKGYLFIKRNVIKEWPYGVCAINAAVGYPVKEALSSAM